MLQAFIRPFGFLLSLSLLSVSLFAWSRQVPGFGYDEARLGLIAHRIAVDPEYWPWVTLSNYATALGQYLVALGFKLFGTSIAVYRAVGKVEFLMGVCFISGSLALAGESLAAIAFPGLAAFFPAVVLNQRWTVELTTFAVFCAGLTILGLTLRWKRGVGWTSSLLIFFGVVLAVTCHVIVFAHVIALWYCLYVSGHLKDKRDRVLVSGIFAVLILFFVTIFNTESRRLGTSAAIFATAMAVGLTWTLFPKKWRNLAFLVPSVLGSLLLLPFCVYLEGNWLAKQFNGFIENPLWVGTLFIPIGFLMWGLRREWKRESFLPFYCYFVLSLMGIYSMASKVGGRFLEIPFLLCTGVLALGFARLGKRQRPVFAILWVFFGTGVIWQNYLRPSIEERQISATFRLGKFMRDSSEDFMPRLKYARKLSEQGCQLADLLPESRWYELQFMSLGDWPLPQQGSCRLGHAIDLTAF